MLILSFVALSSLGLGACISSSVYTSNVESSYPAEGQRLEVGGKNVHVIVRGPEAAPPVLMIHGASANAREYTSSLAPHLDDSLRLLMADRPGHGWSDRFDGAEMLGAQARQMAGVLDQMAPGRKAVIVGHSFGGAVALRLALDRPDLIAGVVLLAPVTHDWGEGSGTAWYNALASVPVAGPVFSQVAPLVGPSLMRSGVESVFDPAPVPPGYFEAAGLPLLLRPPNFRANARDMTALKTELAEQSARYGEITAPVIVFSGSQDTVLAPRLHTARLKTQIPLELVALPDEGHMPHHGESEAVANAIRRLAIGAETR